MATDKKNKSGSNGRLVAQNRKARFSYEVFETFEAGLVLKGTEAKSIRDAKISIEEAYAKLQGDELFLVGAHVQEYVFANRLNHEPTRRRKLLLHRREIRKIKVALEQKGLTLIPLEVHFSPRGWAKITVGLCKAKNTHDKRETLKKRSAQREIREMS